LGSAIMELSPQSLVLIATGSNEVVSLGLPEHVEAVKLPAVRKVDNESYAARRLDLPEAEIFEIRSALLQAAVDSFCPDVLIADKHPSGVHGELRDALSSLRRQGGRSVLGLRDILDEPCAVRREWKAHDLEQEIERNHDQVLIYGDPRVFNPVLEYGFGPALAARTRFCGYVCTSSEPTAAQPPPPAQGHRRHPLVLATTGGGEDGSRMLAAFIESAADAEWDGIVVTGPMVPRTELKALQDRAHHHGVSVQTLVKGLPAWFPSMDAVVCMGGYNTIVEAVSCGAPVVCVPRSWPRAEQLIRARAFAKLGLLEIVEPTQLSSKTLRTAIGRALRQSSRELRDRARSVVRFDGAQRAAAHLLRLALERREPAAKVLSCEPLIR
jgi:predicted glycosyltransferase